MWHTTPRVPGNTRQVTCLHDHPHKLGICRQAGEGKLKKQSKHPWMDREP